MSQLVTSTYNASSKKRILLDNKKEDVRPAKMHKPDPTDIAGNIASILKIVSDIAATSERPEKVLDNHEMKPIRAGIQRPREPESPRRSSAR